MRDTPDAGAIHPPEEGQQVSNCECPLCRVISKREPSVIPLNKVLKVIISQYHNVNYGMSVGFLNNFQHIFH